MRSQYGGFLCNDPFDPANSKFSPKTDTRIPLVLHSNGTWISNFRPPLDLWGCS